MHSLDTINQSNILFGWYHFNLDKLMRLIFMLTIRKTPRECSFRLIFIFTFWLDFPLLFRSMVFLWHNQYNVDMKTHQTFVLFVSISVREPNYFSKVLSQCLLKHSTFYGKLLYLSLWEWIYRPTIHVSRLTPLE